MVEPRSEYDKRLDVLVSQIACFGSETETKVFAALAASQSEMAITDIISALRKRGLEKGIEESNIRKYLRKWRSHNLVRETYKGRPKRYKIEEIGIGSLIGDFRRKVRVRPLRGSPRFRDKWTEWNEELVGYVLSGFFEKYAKSKKHLIKNVYTLVDTHLQKIGYSEINWTTLLDLVDEALYQMDPNLGYRFRLIGATPDYWERYSRIKDALDVHGQPYEKKILTDLHLQKLPDYILPFFTEGRLYGHGLTNFSKPFSISIDMRPFLRYGIRIPQYPADPPKHPDSVLAFCRKILILCSQQAAASIVINNCNTVLSPYLHAFNENDLEQWLQNLIYDLYELYALRPKDPTFCALTLDYECSPLETQTVVREGTADGSTYNSYEKTARNFVDKFLLAYDKAFQKIIYRPYPRMFLRVSRKTFELLPESSINSILNIMLRFGENSPIYFINTESKLYRPNITFSVETQAEGYVKPQSLDFSGISSFISVILPALQKDEEHTLDLCKDMFSSIAQFDQQKRNEIVSKTEDEIETGILSMKGESLSLYDPQNFSLNVGAFGVVDLLSDSGNPKPADVYRFLCKLKGEIKIAETQFPQDIHLSMAGRRSRIHRAYQYFRTGEAPSRDLSDSVDSVCSLLSELDLHERIKWEARLHEVLDGGYVSRFGLGNTDDFASLIDNVLKSDVLLFKIDSTNTETLKS